MVIKSYHHRWWDMIIRGWLPGGRTFWSGSGSFRKDRLIYLSIADLLLFCQGLGWIWSHDLNKVKLLGCFGSRRSSQEWNLSFWWRWSSTSIFLIFHPHLLWNICSWIIGPVLFSAFGITKNLGTFSRLRGHHRGLQIWSRPLPHRADRRWGGRWASGTRLEGYQFYIYPHFSFSRRKWFAWLGWGFSEGEGPVCPSTCHK